MVAQVCDRPLRGVKPARSEADAQGAPCSAPAEDGGNPLETNPTFPARIDPTASGGTPGKGVFMNHLLAQTTTTGPPPYPITIGPMEWATWVVVVFWTVVALVVVTLLATVVLVWRSRRGVEVQA